MTTTPDKLQFYARFPNGAPVPIVYPSGVRVTEPAVSVSSTAAAALPAGSILIEVRATQSVWLRFGPSGVAAADTSSDSILFPAGEKVIPVPVIAGVVATHFRAILSSDATADANVQIERIDCA